MGLLGSGINKSSNWKPQFTSKPKRHLHPRRKKTFTSQDQPKSHGMTMAYLMVQGLLCLVNFLSNLFIFGSLNFYVILYYYHLAMQKMSVWLYGCLFVCCFEIGVKICMRMVKAQDYFETYISQSTMVESCFNEVVIFSNTIESISKSLNTCIFERILEW